MDNPKRKRQYRIRQEHLAANLDSPAIEFYSVSFAELDAAGGCEPLIQILDVIFSKDMRKAKPLVCLWGFQLFEKRLASGEPIKRPTALEITSDAEEQRLRALIQSVKVAANN